MFQYLSITNVSELDVKFFLKCQPTFSVSVESVFLGSQDTVEIRVEFDPAYKVDRACGVRANLNNAHLFVNTLFGWCS